MASKILKNDTFICSDRGDVAIFLTVLVLFSLLAMALGVSLLLLGEIKMSEDASRSVQAFYAADAGVEECAYQIFFLKEPAPIGGVPKTDQTLCWEQNSGFSRTLDNLTTLQTKITASSSVNTVITSLGAASGFNRKIEATFGK